MRCIACNKKLNKIESIIKNPITKEFEDMCIKCLKICKGEDYFEQDFPDEFHELLKQYKDL